MSTVQAKLRWPLTSILTKQRVSFDPANSPLTRYNSLILRNAEKGNLPKALALANQFAVRYKDVASPNLETFEAIAKAFAVHGLKDEVFRLIDDARATGISPDVAIWNQVLRVSEIYLC